MLRGMSITFARTACPCHATNGFEVMCLCGNCRRTTHANDMSLARCRCVGRSSVAVTAVKCCPSLLMLLVNRCVCSGRHLSETGRLHVPIVGPNGRSNPGYVRQSVRQVWQTVWTDCSRTARICQSNQCDMLANYNTADAAAWLVVRLASRSDQSDVVSTRFDSRLGSRTESKMYDSSTVCPTVGRSVNTIRS